MERPENKAYKAKGGKIMDDNVTLQAMSLGDSAVDALKAMLK